MSYTTTHDVPTCPEHGRALIGGTDCPECGMEYTEPIPPDKPLPTVALALLAAAAVFTILLGWWLKGG